MASLRPQLRVDGGSDPELTDARHAACRLAAAGLAISGFRGLLRAQARTKVVLYKVVMYIVVLYKVVSGVRGLLRAQAAQAPA